jgi:hypothetical protein
MSGLAPERRLPVVIPVQIMLTRRRGPTIAGERLVFQFLPDPSEFASWPTIYVLF